MYIIELTLSCPVENHKSLPFSDKALTYEKNNNLNPCVFYITFEKLYTELTLRKTPLQHKLSLSLMKVEGYVLVYFLFTM